MSIGIQLHITGDFACVAHPEMMVERVSYEVITPSAAREILKAIFWKPPFRWIIDCIQVLKPSHFTHFRRPETGTAFANPWAASRIIRDLGTSAPATQPPTT